MSPDDILAELPRELRQPQRTKAPRRRTMKSHVQGLSASANSLLAILGTERIGMDFDALVRATGFAASDLSQSLMELELSGLVVNTQGHYQFAPESMSNIN